MHFGLQNWTMMFESGLLAGQFGFLIKMKYKFVMRIVESSKSITKQGCCKYLKGCLGNKFVISR